MQGNHFKIEREKNKCDKKQFKEDDSYLAQAEALSAIGKCGDRSHLSFLKEAAKMESPRNVIKRAADGAIKEINKT